MKERTAHVPIIEVKDLQWPLADERGRSSLPWILEPVGHKR